MRSFRYISDEKSPFINNGDILEQEPTTWSIKRVNSEERDEVQVLYVKGFDGKDCPIRFDKFEEV